MRLVQGILRKAYSVELLPSVGRFAFSVMMIAPLSTF